MSALFAPNFMDAAGASRRILVRLDVGGGHVMVRMHIGGLRQAPLRARGVRGEQDTIERSVS